MRQVFVEKGVVVVKEVSQPLLEEHSVLVSVHYSCISSGMEINPCNERQESMFSNIPYKIKKIIESVSDHGIEGTKALIKGKLLGRPQAVGFSCSGRVIAVGSKVKEIYAGDLVACAGVRYAHHADIVCVPEHLVAQIHAREHIKAASLTAIGAHALQGIKKASVQLGQTVCVIGLDLLGQIMVQLASLSGCTVIAIDSHPDRLKLAHLLGADYVYNQADEQWQKELAFLTHHRGVDATFLTVTSKNDLLQQALEVTCKQGKIVVVGDNTLNVSCDLLGKKEIDLLISASSDLQKNCTIEQKNMQSFVQLIEQRKVRLDELIFRETGLEYVAHAYEQIKNQEALAILLTYDAQSQHTNVAKATQNKIAVEAQDIRFTPAKKDSLRVGIVGAGSFAKIKLLPIISHMDQIKINAVVDADITTSLSVAKQYGAATALVDDEDLFKNDLVDVVVIASPHKFHCDQAIRALSSGKAVFMEKPMGVSFEQYARLQDFLRKNQSVPFCVDYNRSFAPYIQKIKQALVGRHSPVMIHYRMNAGFIPKDYWVQTDSGAGRIIGQACHIFDLFCFLTDSKPIAVSVEAVHGVREDIFPTDNFSAQISFEDGSICTLLYTALGHSKLGKERMEVFFDAKTIVMDDYAQLHGFGFPSTFHETTMSPSKGHEELISAFFESVKKPNPVPVMSLSRMDTVMQLTLTIDALACEGGGTKQLTL